MGLVTLHQRWEIPEMRETGGGLGGHQKAPSDSNYPLPILMRDDTLSQQGFAGSTNNAYISLVLVVEIILVNGSTRGFKQQLENHGII